MTERLTRNDYRTILALIEADIHKTKDMLNPPPDAEWGLTNRERQEFTASLKQLQSIHKKLCYRAWPKPINHCDQESIRHLVDSPLPFRPDETPAQPIITGPTRWPGEGG